MKCFGKRLILSWMIATLVAPVNLWAQSARFKSAADEARFTQYQNHLEGLGYELHMDASQEKANVVDKNTKKLVMEIPFSSEERIRQFSPENLNKKLTNEMKKIRSSGQAAWSQTLKNMPMESAVFFLAMGAVVAGQLVTNYAQNPVGMEQHLQHQLSPVGIASFFSFMYAQGITTNVLSLYMRNPKFHVFMPYLGMSVGFFASSYLSVIMSEPNVKACAKTMMGLKLSQKDLQTGASQTPCETAYENLAVKKMMWQLAPSLVSMLASTALAGVGQSILTKAVLRVTGFDLAMWLTPGAMHVKGLRLILVKGLQMTAFVAIDVWLHSKVTYAWKNIFDGRELKQIKNDLESSLNKAKNQQWKNTADLMANLKQFKLKAGEWRMTNMAEVYEAHHNWSEHLKQLTGMYNASYAFYNSLARELSAAQKGEKSQLTAVYPLNQVKAHNLAEGKEDLYHSHPHFVEPMQVETLNYLGAALLENLQKNQNTDMTKKEKTLLLQFAKDLQSDEVLVLAKTLEEMQRIQRDAQRSPQAHSLFLIKTLQDALTFLGNPVVSQIPGRHFVSSFAQAPSHQNYIGGIEYSTLGNKFATPQITDFFIHQMLCGPKAGESLIATKTGFKSKFVPPSILNRNTSLLDFCSLANPKASVNQMYAFPIRLNGKTHSGPLDLIVNNSQVLETGLLGDFNQWWQNTSEAQMISTFKDFSIKYQQIVGKLVEKLNLKERSNLNMGPFENGILLALDQEFLVYLDILKAISQEQDFSAVQRQRLLGQIHTDFKELTQKVQKIQVRQNGSETVITSNFENHELEEIADKLKLALQVFTTEIQNQSKLSPSEEELITLLSNHIQELSMEVVMLGSIANAVDWNKIRALKAKEGSSSEFNNRVQNMLNNMRGATSPVK
ncbi:MAG: hypothetical protein ACLGGX_00285 [Bdellovibrionia bacterium]